MKSNHLAHRIRKKKQQTSKQIKIKISHNEGKKCLHKQSAGCPGHLCCATYTNPVVPLLGLYNIGRKKSVVKSSAEATIIKKIIDFGCL